MIDDLKPRISFVSPIIGKRWKNSEQRSPLGVIALPENQNDPIEINFEIFITDLDPNKIYSLNVQLLSGSMEINFFSEPFDRKQMIFVGPIATSSYIAGLNITGLSEGKYSVHINLLEIVSSEENTFEGKVINSFSLYLLGVKEVPSDE